MSMVQALPVGCRLDELEPQTQAQLRRIRDASSQTVTSSESARSAINEYHRVMALVRAAPRTGRLSATEQLLEDRRQSW